MRKESNASGTLLLVHQRRPVAVRGYSAGRPPDLQVFRQMSRNARTVSVQQRSTPALLAIYDS